MPVLLLLLTLLLTLPAHGATRYVATTGNDANSCAAMTNSNTPRRTINAGIQCLQGGDTLMVRSGTYSEYVQGEAIPSGTSSVPTVVRAETRRTAIIQPSGVQDLVTFGQGGTNQHYIIFQGFVLDAINNGNNTNAGINLTGQFGTDHLTMDDIEIKNIRMLDDTNASHNGLFWGWPMANTTFKNGSIHDIGLGSENNGSFWAYGIYGLTGIFEKNEMYNVTGYGIHQYSSGGTYDNTVIRNNFFHDVGTLLVNCGTGGVNNIIYNNILLRVGTTAASQDRQGFRVCRSNTRLYNNTIVGGGFGPGGGTKECIQLGGSGQTVQNNICYQNADNSITGAAGSTVDHNLLGTNPLFVSGSPSVPADFQLQSGSPAINAGVSTASFFTTDYGGQARIQGAAQDLGVWEFGSTVITPSQTPLVYWPLNEGTGSTAADATGNNHTLTWTSGVSWTAGKVGLKALRCDGSGGQATLTDDLPTPQYTWMFWTQGATAPTLSSDQVIFGKAGQFAFFWSSNDNCCVLGASHTLADGSYIIPPKIPGPLLANKWYHVTGTYDGSQVQVYLNGQPQASTPASSILAASGPTQFCAATVTQFDDVRIWNRALPQAEIVAEYNRTKRTAAHRGGTMR